MADRPALRWWSRKIRRFVSYVRANVSEGELAELGAWLTSGERSLFEAMPRPDQRHGLDVAAALRGAGYGADREVLLAGLLHDAGKGHGVRLWHRVAWSLGQRYGRWIVTAAAVVPGARTVLERLDRHADLSADLAQGAGVPPRTVELIRMEGDPRDPAAVALRLADEGEL